MQFYARYRHLLILGYFVFYLIGFSYVEQTVTTQFHIIGTPLDDMIPFCEYFIIPYLLWFGYVAWGILYFALHNKEDYYKLCGFLFTGMTVFLLVSFLYPNGHYLRPAYFTHHNFFTTLCSWIYAADTSTNLFPSIHVYNSIGIHLAVMKSREFKQHKFVRLCSGILAASIILSTMFVKQHSVFDVFTAFLLSYVMYHIIYVHRWHPISRKTAHAAGKYKNRLPQT